MLRSVRCAGLCWSSLPATSLLLFLLSGVQGSGYGHIQETVRVNVTSLHEIKVIQQISFNISYDKGQVHLNGFPASKGDSRITSKMDITNYGTSNYQENLTYKALVNVRLLVLHISKNTSAGVSRIIVQHEVLTVDGNKVDENKTTELVFTVNKEMEVLRYSSTAISLEETWLHSIPWNSDASFTFPNIPESAGDRVPQQTTREYGNGQNTTLDEEPFPDKLPETPIRALVPAYSYMVMCKFAEDVRETLCHIWFVLYPILVNLLQVVVCGVIGAAIVLELLRIASPLREQKEIFKSSDLKESPKFVPLMLSTTTMDTFLETQNNL